MAITGGKINWHRPLDFANGIVVIGDWETSSDVPSSVVIGSAALAVGATKVGAVVIGRQAESDNNNGTVVVGAVSFALINSDYAIILGSNSTTGGVGNLSTETIVIGHHHTTSGNNSRSVLIGAQGLGVLNSERSVVIGYANHVTESQRSVVIGYQAQTFYVQPTETDEPRFIAIGYQAACYGNQGTGKFAIALGCLAVTYEEATSGIAIGYNATVYAANTVSVGENASCWLNTVGSVAVGADTTIQTDCYGNTAVGPAITITAGNGGSINSVVLGHLANLSGGSSSSVVIGYAAQVHDHSGQSVVIGYRALADNYSSDAVVIGQDALVNAGNSHPPAAFSGVALGYQARAGFAAIAIGSYTGPSDVPTSGDREGTVIGNSSTFTSLNPNNDSLVLGIRSSLTNSCRAGVIGSDNQIDGRDCYVNVLGHGNILTRTLISGTALLIVGAGNVAAADVTNPSSLIFGNENHSTNSVGSIVIGRNNVLASGEDSLVFGDGNSIPAGATLRTTVIGDNNTVTASYAITIGNHITNSTDNTMVVGDNADAADAIHRMVVWGYNGGSFITIAFDDNPDDGKTGMTIAYNTGEGIVNRDVYISNTPPVGAAILYMVP
jgi:hypothetical protein